MNGRRLPWVPAESKDGTAEERMGHSLELCSGTAMEGFCTPGPRAEAPSLTVPGWHQHQWYLAWDQG